MFPTHVGMNRPDRYGRQGNKDVPHARGDEPKLVPPKAVKVFEKKGDIYVKFNNGGTKQLTFDGINFDPVLSSSRTKVAFIKKTFGNSCSTGVGDFEGNELWLINLGQNKKEKMLIRGKPTNNEDYRTGRVLCALHSPQFSADEKKIYFISGAGAVTDAIHQIDIDGSNWEHLTGGNSLEVIYDRKSKYYGYLIINKHKYFPEGGSYDCDWLVSPEGKETKLWSCP